MIEKVFFLQCFRICSVNDINQEVVENKPPVILRMQASFKGNKFPASQLERDAFFWNPSRIQFIVTLRLRRTA